MKYLAGPLLFVTMLAVPVGCPSDVEPEPTPDPALGVDPGIAAAPGEARAGAIREGGAGIFGGIASEARVGDVMIHNARVRFVVQAPRVGHGYVDTAGGIIDVDVVRPPGELGRDTVDDIFISLGAGRLADADSVVVVNDGTNGEPAVVRATGGDVPWTFIQGAVESEDPILEDQGLEIVTDYELAADSWSVKVTTTFTNAGLTESRFNVTDGFMAADEVLDGWASDAGIGQSVEEFLAVGAVGTGAEASLSVWRTEGTLRSLGIAQLASSAGLNFVSHGWETLAIGDSRVVERFWTAAPDPLTAEGERWRARGVALAAVSGTVSGPDGGVAGARVHFVSDDDRVLGFAVTGPDGGWSTDVPLGDYRLVAEAEGHDELADLPAGAGRMAPYVAPAAAARVLGVLDGSVSAVAPAVGRGRAVLASTALSVAAAGATADLQVGATGNVRVQVVDEMGALLPAVLEIDRAAGEPHPIAADVMDVADRLGLVTSAARAARVWSDGDVEVALPVGLYEVSVHHSWRHSRELGVAFEVVAGGTTDVEVVLTEVVPRDGRLAMDSHLHAAPSNDSDIPMEDRLLQCAALGVDLPVTTDHDRVSDYRPLATALGLDERMTVVPGVEVSPVLRGHVNVFPTTILDEPNAGAEPWWIFPETTDELYERMRTGAGQDAVLQVNHPRSGMFDFGGWRPDDGLPMRSDFFSWSFDAFELVNGKRTSSIGDVRTDWFSFLNLGELRTPTGVSDSHGHGSPCGYGRTDLMVDAASPVGVDLDVVREAIQGGNTIVAVGLTATVTLNAGGVVNPGGLGTGASATLDVEVRSPDWIVPDMVRVYRNGEVIEELTIEGPAVDGVWFDDSIEVSADDDSWFVVEIVGSTPFGGYFGDATAYAAPNAFRLDVTGDGWAAPGLP
jgi:hypothetical protein